MSQHHLDVSGLYRKLQSAENGFHVVNPDLRQDAVVLKGDFNYVRLRAGLSLHTSDVVETCDVQCLSETSPGLSFLFFSRGAADVSFGDRKFQFGSGAQRNFPADAVIVNRKERDSFTRQMRRGAAVRKMSINMSSEWLDNGGLDSVGDFGGLKPFLNEHLSARHFAPSTKLHRLIEEVMCPPSMPDVLRRLFMESRSIEIVVEMLNALTEAMDDVSLACMSEVEKKRLRLAIDYIEMHIDQVLNIDDIAHNAGISASSLQRLFHAARHCSVFEYVRGRKMELAMKALKERNLSVSQAAYIAGYSNPANFSTAFRKVYGLTPSQARKH